MYQKRIARVLQNMEASGLEQMLISDPPSIFYLTGRWILPNERLLALYLNKNGSHKLFVNKLFSVDGDIGMEKVWFSDTDPGCRIIASYTDHEKMLGIDKKMAARFLLELMELGAASGYKNASECVDGARRIKDEDEIEKMILASRLNDQAMARFRGLLKEGVTELEVAAGMNAIYKELGTEGPSFGPLVSFGANAAIGHHKPDHTVLKEGDCVLFDVGCRKNSYCSDMTRTFFYRSVSEKGREVYEIVKKANLAAQAAMKPGMKFCEIDQVARDIITEAGYGPYFTHRLGHCIGIEVHDAGDVSAVNQDVVKEGMIFSCEPGIYLPGELGVRIEDLMLITKDGAVSLNKDSKELEVLPFGE
ncbi:MAG: aminopeptidase P family protein [Lachnospiraceae bacterium]|nr:aminopeptidase P family protein [Lachnospiraceae bacterium]